MKERSDVHMVAGDLMRMRRTLTRSERVNIAGYLQLKHVRRELPCHILNSRQYLHSFLSF